MTNLSSLVQSLGPTGSAVKVVLTGNGSATSFVAAHNLNSRSIEWYFETDTENSPIKVSSWVPTTGDELDSSTVTIPGPIGNGVVVNGYARLAG